RAARYGPLRDRLMLPVVLARRFVNRTREFAFPVSSGLPATPIDDVIAPMNHVNLAIENWSGDSGAGSFWDLTSILLIAHHLQPRCVFEIGTGHGRTTLNLALNTSPDVELHTLDITHDRVVGCLFRERPASEKIKRIVADSKRFDF